MKDKYVESKLGEIIYTLGEQPFDFIKANVWHEHINFSKPFKEEQIEFFEQYLKYLIEDYEILIKAQENFIDWAVDEMGYINTYGQRLLASINSARKHLENKTKQN